MSELMYTNATPLRPGDLVFDLSGARSIDFSPVDFDKALNRAFEIETAPKVDRIIFNNPATIVFWKDGTKTVVKTSEDSEFSYYWGFCAALAEKVFGSNHAVKTMIRKNCNLNLDKQLNLKDEAKSK